MNGEREKWVVKRRSVTGADPVLRFCEYETDAREWVRIYNDGDKQKRVYYKRAEEVCDE